MSLRERTIRQKLKSNFHYYAKKCLKIRTKLGAVTSLELNRAQAHLHERIERQIAETGKARVLVLKGRQQGCSTYVEGRFYHKATHRKGVRVFILTHRDDATTNIYKMARRYHDNCPDLVKPSTSASNAKELVFNRLESSYGIGTAKAEGTGRSDTIQYFHGSEVAYWLNADKHAMGVMQAVPDAPGTEIILESTANGVGNYFHQQWQLAESGKSEYIAVFIPWFWQDEYKKPVPKGFVLDEDEAEYKEIYALTDGQMVWRRTKVSQLSANGVDGTWRFRQEYPATPQEAFQTSNQDSLIKPEKVIKARKEVLEDSSFVYSPLLVGVDPARFGDDRTSFVIRQGRKVHRVESKEKIDTMETAGLCIDLLKSGYRDRGKIVPVKKLFVDVIGLGAGVVDRLRELGFSDRVIAVNAAEKAMDKERYFNKRTEMWALMSEWFDDTPCQIPDLDSLHSDLVAPGYGHDSNGRLKLESKDDIKKRGLRSPDEGDALALTFSMPIAMGTDWSKPLQYDNRGIV